MDAETQWANMQKGKQTHRYEKYNGYWQEVEIEENVESGKTGNTRRSSLGFTLRQG